MKQITVAICLLSTFACVGCGSPKGLLSKVPFMTADSRYLPDTGDISGLIKVTKIKSYSGKDMVTYLGPMANLIIQYGAQGVSTADYYLGNKEQTLTIESFTMDYQESAAGLFHYYRGRKLRGLGTAVNVGTEGVLDRKRECRNLYFYKNRNFFKVIYSGRTKIVPDLTGVANALAQRVPGGKSMPDGFKYAKVQGVDQTTINYSPGYTYNCTFLPAGVLANAPGAGPVAELFIIAHIDRKSAQQTANDFMYYLENEGENYNLMKRKNGRKVWTARERVQGRVVCTVYDKYIVGVVRPRTNERGEEVINQVLMKIYEDMKRR